MISFGLQPHEGYVLEISENYPIVTVAKRAGMATLLVILEDSGEVLQTLVHQRYMLKRSIVGTSHRVVQDMGDTPDCSAWGV